MKRHSSRRRRTPGDIPSWPANPARVRASQERRRSNAAGTHTSGHRTGTRSQRERDAIRDQWS